MDIHEIIKAIRIELGISQEAFARELHVGFAAVNRWENQKAKPNQIARYAIAELCIKKKISKELIAEFNKVK